VEVSHRSASGCGCLAKDRTAHGGAAPVTPYVDKKQLSSVLRASLLYVDAVLVHWSCTGRVDSLTQVVRCYSGPDQFGLEEPVTRAATMTIYSSSCYVMKPVHS
jgi:hypothetical protein